MFPCARCVSFSSLVNKGVCVCDVYVHCYAASCCSCQLECEFSLFFSFSSLPESSNECVSFVWLTTSMSTMLHRSVAVFVLFVSVHMPKLGNSAILLGLVVLYFISPSLVDVLLIQRQCSLCSVLLSLCCDVCDRPRIICLLSFLSLMTELASSAN